MANACMNTDETMFIVSWTVIGSSQGIVADFPTYDEAVAYWDRFAKPYVDRKVYKRVGVQQLENVTPT